MQYDPFQLKAIEAIQNGRSVLVSAPTGAGKTAIAEYAITQSLSRNERVVYTAPIKALSNQKFRDFSSRYPDKVGLLTGDVTLNADAPVLIMTTEIYRNQLFENPERLQNTRWVIFDEVHYLDDPERGTVWEEAMMFSPEHVSFVALSATAPNVDELAEWIRTSLHKEIEVIIETHRPVPLIHQFQCQGQIHEDPRALRKDGYLNHEHWSSGRRDRFQQGGGRHGRHEKVHKQNFGRFMHAKPNRTDTLINHLRTSGQLPCLYFAFGRKRTEELAWEQIHFNFLSRVESDAALKTFDELCEKFELKNEPSAHEMRRLVERGIAFHHAGMLPTLKEVIERLFTSKHVQLIFTTETFALGINMPAKAVVFDELRKFNGIGFGFLRTRDYFQMAGRAGRRGMDSQGFVYSRINPHDIPYPAVTRIVYGAPEPIESQFNSCYATILNLYDKFGSKLIDMYPRSFHHFQSNRKDREKGVELIQRKISLLRDLGHIRGEKLTSKGEFASWMYGYELALSEMLEQGFLETLNEASLSALLSALVFEPRKNQSCEHLPPNLAALEKNASRLLRPIHIKESQNKIYPLTRDINMHLAQAIEAWVHGARFHEIGRHTEVDEGEVIRYFRMVIQLLRQLKQAPKVSDRLREIAGKAQRAINRDLVDAEKQLRNMDESETNNDK
jgi:superfamily II RNA helicase